MSSYPSTIVVPVTGQENKYAMCPYPVLSLNVDQSTAWPFGVSKEDLNACRQEIFDCTREIKSLREQLFDIKKKLQIVKKKEIRDYKDKEEYTLTYYGLVTYKDNENQGTNEMAHVKLFGSFLTVEFNSPVKIAGITEAKKEISVVLSSLKHKPKTKSHYDIFTFVGNLNTTGNSRCSFKIDGVDKYDLSNLTEMKEEFDNYFYDNTSMWLED